MRVLVVNHGHSVVCGIHDLGLRVFHQLRRSTVMDVGYAECGSIESYLAACAAHDPDAMIVNHRSDLMPWTRLALPRFPAVKIAIAHNYDEASINRAGRGLIAEGYDYVLALDPFLTPSDPRIFAVGRAIPQTVPRGARRHPPRIGSFGFAFPHKRFDNVAAEINASLDEAVYNLHMPEAFFNGANGAPLYTQGILDACRAEITKPGIILNHTSEHLDERDLVERLAVNDVNCLFYVPGQPDAGLSSALDYLIAARRPILLSDAAMFRWVQPGTPTWPKTTLTEVLADYQFEQRSAEVRYEASVGRLLAGVEKMMGEIL